MPQSKNKVLERLREKVRLVEKSGQKNTVHHQNLANYLESLKEAKKSTTPKIKEKVKEEQDGK